MQGSSQPQSTTTTTKQELSPEQQRLLSLAMPAAENFAANPPKQYPGTAIVDTDPLVNQAREQALGAGGTIQQLSDGANSSLMSLFSGGPQAPALQSSPIFSAPGITSNTDINNAQHFLLSDVMNPANNPALRGAVDAAVRPLTDSFSNTIMPGIQGNAIANGALGGSRQGVAQGLASNALLRGIGDTSSTMLNKAYSDNLQAMVNAFGIGNQRMSAIDQQNTARTSDLNTTLLARDSNINNQNTLRTQNSSAAMLSALERAPSLANMALLPSQVTEAVGSQRQSEAQARLSEMVQRYLSEQMIPFSAAQDVAALAFGMPGGSTASTSTGPKPADNTMGQILGMAGMAAQFLPFIT